MPPLPTMSGDIMFSGMPSVRPSVVR